MGVPTILKQPADVLQGVYNKLIFCIRSSNWTPPVPSVLTVINSQQIGNDPAFYPFIDGDTIDILGQTFTWRTTADPLNYEIPIVNPITGTAQDEEDNLLAVFTTLGNYKFFTDFFDYSIKGASPDKYIEVWKTSREDWDLASYEFLTGRSSAYGLDEALIVTGSAGYSSPNFSIGANLVMDNGSEVFLSKTGRVVDDAGVEVLEACFDIQNFVQPHVKTKLPNRALNAQEFYAEGLLIAVLEYFEIFGTPPLPQLKYQTKDFAFVNASVTYPHLTNRMKEYSLIDTGNGFKFLTEIPNVSLCPSEKHWLYLALPAKFNIPLQGNLYVRNKTAGGAVNEEQDILINHTRGVMIIPTHASALAAMGITIDMTGCYYLEWRTVQQEQVIGQNEMTVGEGDPFDYGEIGSAIDYVPARPTVTFAEYETGRILKGIKTISLTKDKVYRAKMSMAETFPDIASGAAGAYKFVARAGVGYSQEVIKTMDIGQNADDYIETWVTPTQDVEIYLDVELETEADLTPAPDTKMEFFDWEVYEYELYPDATSEEYQVCPSDCCDCDTELIFLNRVGGMDKVKACELGREVSREADEYYHDEAEVIGDREFKSVNTLNTETRELEFDYSSPNMRQLVEELIRSADVWEGKGDDWHPVTVQEGRYKLDERGRKIFTTVKIIDGHLNRRQHIFE